MLPALPNLRHLDAFREISRSGTVSAAASAVHLSQPAITQAVAALEGLFGATLFNRSHLGMKLTDAGEVCLRRVERTLDQIRSGVAECRGATRSRANPTSPRAITSAQLQALVAVVEHHGFAAAARQSGLSRPSLHRAARALEHELGVDLFERTSFGVEPTREAVELARRLTLAFTELEQARAEIAALGGGDAGRTVIGAMPLARTALVPQTVLEFAAEHPAHTLTILDGPYEGMLETLRRGAADLLVGALRDPVPFADVVQEVLFEDPLALVVRAGHPLAAQRRASLRELARYAWIAPRKSSPLRAQFDALTSAIGVEAAARPIECNSLVAARALLLGSDRIMLLSEHQIRHELTTRQLVSLEHPLGGVVRTIGLTMRRDWQPTRAQTSLLGCLRRHAASSRQRDV